MDDNWVIAQFTDISEHFMMNSDPKWAIMGAVCWPVVTFMLTQSQRSLVGRADVLVKAGVAV